MGIFEDRYRKLNNEQKEAVDNIEGPMLVVAGPGSGKTELLSLRVANILKKTDVYPSNILCLTFTESAAINMRERLSDLIGSDAYRVAIHTFHSFGVEIMNMHQEYFHEGASFSAADELMQLEFLDGIFDGLPYDNPLKKEHPKEGYIYLKASKRAIEQLKKAGISPKELHEILKHNEAFCSAMKKDIADVFDRRISKKEIGSIEKLLQKALELQEAEFPVKQFGSLRNSFCNSLSGALNGVKDSGKMAELTKWKSEWTKKDIDGMRALKTELNQKKMEALADVYGKYQKTMFDNGYYDFDDMILKVIGEIERNESLRYEIREKYQYILVDEFQDTNDAQMRLVDALLDAKENEGRPNIMAVGDDDQAIFKFQGAEISNIMGFRKKYRDVRMVVLKSNYRSTQEILDSARVVIKNGNNRLENLIPEIEKELVAGNQSVPKGKVVHAEFETREEEDYWVAREVKRFIDEGSSPSAIAVIARRHEDLERIVPFFLKLKMPIRYERQQNVLNEIHIRQVIQMSRFVVSLSQKNRQEADEYLPEILSYSFWNIERKTIWKLSLNQRKLWIESMLEGENAKLKEIAEFFLEMAARASYEPLEYVLSAIIGANEVLLEEESEDEAKESAMAVNTKTRSPFKEYYFSRDKLKDNRDEYVRYLSSLKIFIQALREYKSGKPVFLKDLVEFVDVHEKNGIKLTDKSSFVNASEAVELMTVHKAKGLEYDTVFIINCQEGIWAKGSNANKLRFPENLKIAPMGDDIDDQLRLFYVAMTRARSNLFATAYQRDGNGKESEKLHFMELDSKKNEMISIKKDSSDWDLECLALGMEAVNAAPFTGDEKAVLLPIIEKYKMSVTHLNNFLNVKDAGPQAFFEQNLLRFPQPKSVAGVFGTAIHSTMNFVLARTSKTKKVPDLQGVLSEFERYLEKERLSKEDFEHYLKRGKDALSFFYDTKKSKFDPSHRAEMDFSNQGVVINGVPISGKIDKIIMEGDAEMVVSDYKTGSASLDWNGTSPDEKIKLYNYRKQLIFYKLLVENSREYKNKFSVKRGVLEYIESKNGKIVDLDLLIDPKEAERLEKLIAAVYAKIQKLEFPDVSKYSKDKSGIIEFEGDLISGRI
ncbi:MAG: ATP-dependent DNA helicase [Candidatus Paceibacterota bacterium]|jgi:DNA helicase-2/ATP-dependent DNA helicase PcrA